MSEKTTRHSTQTIRTLRVRINWPLIIGSLLIFIILFLSLFGPSMAPKDPREHNLIIQVDGAWMTPPYKAFTPGFPLGSDNLGRDLYSWLLWAIRPTMTLVIIVASIRMVLGVVIGVIAGWSDQLVGRLFDWLIAGALAVPTLIAALIIITAVGFKLGVWAFVVGMSVTGWAETAQLVRERTRTIKGQDAVEASIALGASNAQTFFLHILPQVMPMIWMLLAFEVANSLVTSAGLGFLGYYLGGAVFTEVDDFVYQRISEMPELGQMLATAWLVLDEPWAMVAAGTVVFAIVLAFNLLGDGLQSRLTRKLGGTRSLYSFLAGQMIPWLDKQILYPVSSLIRYKSFRYNAGVIIILLFGVSLVWIMNPWANMAAIESSQTKTSIPASTSTAVPGKTESIINPEDKTGTESIDTIGADSALVVPGEHIWAAEGYDPWHSRWVNFSGPMTTTVQWTIEREGGFVGGPVVNAEGTLYISTRKVQENGTETGTVIALDAKGIVLWETPLDREPVGSPALAADGTLYVADKKGINALSPQGESLWQFTTAEGDPTADGPVISPDGIIYFKTYGGMNALTPDGNLKWRRPVTISATSLPPHLSPDGNFVYWQSYAFTANDGILHQWSQLTPWALEPTQVVIGADGETYTRYGERLIRLNKAETLSEAIVFDGTEITWDGNDAGITPDGWIWLSARPSVGGMGLGLYWTSPDGEISAKISIPQQRNIQVIGVDINNIAYVCMDSYVAESRCIAASPNADRPVWSLPLRTIKAVSGAALAPHRLYIATRDGYLYAVGAASSERLPGETKSASPVSPPIDPGPAWAQPEIPGDHIWPMTGRDPWSTWWANFTGPASGDTLWTFDAPTGLTGPPVISADGTLYVNTNGAEVIAINTTGTVSWRLSTPSDLVAAPALGADGTIYVTDKAGYLNAINVDGKLVWRYHPTGIVENPTYSRSGRIIRQDPMPIDALGPAGAGPMVAPDGTIYYSLGVETWGHEADLYFRSEVMIAVSPEGEGLYDPPSFIWSNRIPPRLYTTNDRIIWGDVMLYPLNGKIQEDAPNPYADYINSLFEEQGNVTPYVGMGADGRAYLAFRRTIVTFFMTDESIGVIDTFEWQPDNPPGSAERVGATPNGLRWVFFSSGKFIWIDPDDQVLGPVRFPLESMLIAVDSADIVYGCGSSMGKATECMAYTKESLDPRWHVTLNEGETVIGGSLAPGTLYIATEQGKIYALGE